MKYVGLLLIVVGGALILGMILGIVGSLVNGTFGPGLTVFGAFVALLGVGLVKAGYMWYPETKP
jgi:hypothetical protein